MSEKKYVIKLYKKKKTWIELIPKISEKNMKNEKKILLEASEIRSL